MGWDLFYVGIRLQETQLNQITRERPTGWLIGYVTRWFVIGCPFRGLDGWGGSIWVFAEMGCL